MYKRECDVESVWMNRRIARTNEFKIAGAGFIEISRWQDGPFNNNFTSKGGKAMFAQEWEMDFDVISALDALINWGNLIQHNSNVTA